MVKAWKGITSEEKRNLVEPVSRRLDAVIANKGYATRYEVFFYFTVNKS